MKPICWMLLAATLAAAPSWGWAAQPYPTKPIRVIVPFSPGGTTDTIMRLLSAALYEKIGQPVVVDNRPGAAGNIAMAIAAKANPDGYTLFLASMGTTTINAHLYREMGADPIKDFVPVSLVAGTTTVLTARPSLKIATVKDVVEMARKQPSTLTYASGGVGSLNHVSGMLFEMLSKIKLVHVPFKGGGPAVVAVVGGEVDLLFATIAPALPMIKSGKLTGLAVGSKTRCALMPNIPTMQEAGVGEFEINSWYGLVAPAKTPEPVLHTLYLVVSEVNQSAEVRSRLAAAGLDPMQSTRQQFAALIQSDAAKWAKVFSVADVQRR